MLIWNYYHADSIEHNSTFFATYNNTHNNKEREENIKNGL